MECNNCRRYFLVDYENVKTAGLDGAGILTDNDYVHLFSTRNAAKFSTATLSKFNNTNLKVHEVPVKNQSVDIHLVSYLGFLIGKNNFAHKYIIISMDTDFDDIINYWKYQYKVNIRKLSSIQGIKDKKEDDEVEEMTHFLNQLNTNDGINNRKYNTNKDDDDSSTLSSSSSNSVSSNINNNYSNINSNNNIASNNHINNNGGIGNNLNSINNSDSDDDLYSNNISNTLSDSNHTIKLSKKSPDFVRDLVFTELSDNGVNHNDSIDIAFRVYRLYGKENFLLNIRNYLMNNYPDNSEYYKIIKRLFSVSETVPITTKKSLHTTLPLIELCKSNDENANDCIFNYLLKSNSNSYPNTNHNNNNNNNNITNDDDDDDDDNTMKSLSVNMSDEEEEIIYKQKDSEDIRKEIREALRSKGVDIYTSDEIAFTASKFYGEENFLLNVHNYLMGEFKNHLEYYNIIKTLFPRSKMQLMLANKKNINDLSKKIEYKLSHANCEKDVVNFVVSLIIKLYGTSNYKQNIYQHLVYQFGQVDGIDIYHKIQKLL